MLQNIIDNLKNQGIEPDLAQSNLIEELKDNTIIKLPNDNVNHALNLALEFLDDNNYIDARIENQIILDD